MVRTLIPVLAALGLVACGGPNVREVPSTSTNALDQDGDGFTVGQGDCDDNDADIHPDANDVVGDAVDNNCDGIDGTDGDRDGQASQGTGGTDCDDTQPTIYEGAEEIGWDEIDQDCDGDDRHDFEKLAAGGGHTCGIGSDGFIRCWGDDTYGQVSAAPTSGAWEEIDAGIDFTCALNDSGQVLCWGKDAEGNVEGMTDGPDPTLTYDDLAVGHQFGCALTDDGLVRCWGDDGSNQVSLAPANTEAIEIAAGGEFACIIMRSGELLQCWGNDIHDQVTLAPASDPYTRLALGETHGCAVRVDQGLRCWGNNDNGQANAETDQGPYSRISSFDQFSCGIISNRELTCFGVDGIYNAVEDAPYDLDLVEVEVGADHGCAVRADDGEAVCWGRGDVGQTNVPF
jgi:alpha-tubulin suppressor-like RCC1 family protein